MSVKKDYKKLSEQTKKTKQAKGTGKDEFKEDKDKRLIRLIRLMRIADEGVLNEDKAARACGVSKRTIQRDIKVLIAAGIPLYKENDFNSNYRLTKGWKLFHYNIDEENALAFLRSYRALSYFHDNTQELISPLQQDILKNTAVKQYKKNKDFLFRKEQKQKPLSQEEFVSFLSLIDTTKAEVQERILGSLAFDQYLRRNPYDAIKLNQRLLSLNERSRYYCWIGFSYYRLKNYEKAKEFFLKTLEKDPCNQWGYLHMASMYRGLNNWPEVFAWMEKGLKIMPKNVALNVNMLFFLMENGRYEEALKYIPLANQKKYREYALYAEIYAKLGKYTQALDNINKAIETAPNPKTLLETKERILAVLQKDNKENKN